MFLSGRRSIMDNTALDTLRRRIRQIERRDHTDHAHLRLETGHDPIDHYLVMSR